MLARANHVTPFDASPSSLMDSIASPKVETTEGEGIRACSSARSTLRVEGCLGVPGWD